MTMNYLSVSDFAAYAPEVDTSQFTEATISGMITQSSRKVDAYLGYSPALEVVMNEKSRGMISAEGDLVIFPRKIPIISVEGVSIVKGTYSADLSLTDGQGNLRYDVPDPGWRIVVAGESLTHSSNSIIISHASLRQNEFFTKLSYTAGYETLPADIVRAVVLLTKDILAGQQNVSGAKRIRQGGIDISYGERDGKSDLVQDAEELLSEYRRSTLI
jgi:hypothetical protein